MICDLLLLVTMAIGNKQKLCHDPWWLKPRDAHKTQLTTWNYLLVTTYVAQNLNLSQQKMSYKLRSVPHLSTPTLPTTYLHSPQFRLSLTPCNFSWSSGSAQWMVFTGVQVSDTPLKWLISFLVTPSVFFTLQQSNFTFQPPLTGS